MQRWSVWDPVRQTYEVYVGGLGRDPAVAPITYAPKSALGVAPEVVTPTLPFDAQKVGESSAPVGRIAQRGGGFWIAAAVGLAWVGVRWYRTWRKR